MPTMPSIILASASQRRKALLRQLGLKFTVCPSAVQEDHQVRNSCSRLVKHNACLKARDVAARFRKGCIIAADTVVYQRHKGLIGKPGNLKEAESVLRFLCRHPHWVYTGVAVIDVAGNREFVGYEKTKVYMQPLSDQEIRRYHRKIFPLDKAGGYNIEGRGALFINRVEGCYTNVIGLPLAMLRGMLKKCGVTVL